MASGAVEAMTIWLGQSVPKENLRLLFKEGAYMMHTISIRVVQIMYCPLKLKN